MSIRENIQCFHKLDIETYLEVLKDEFGIRVHPSQPDSFLIGNPGLPFYKPELIEDHLSILSFNNTPLSDLLIQALIDHSELVPDEIILRWTQEQGIILEKTLGELRREQTHVMDDNETSNTRLG